LTGDFDSDDNMLVATRNKHFVNAPMLSFCSDSPSVMVKLHRLCIQDDEFVFAFGCALHALHNLCMDLVKEFPGIKNIVKHMVFLVKTIQKTHLLQQLFDKISKEKYGQTMVLILFTKTRWGTICDAAKRLNRVRTAICQLPTEILSNELNIDLAPKLRDDILDAAFWKGLVALEVLFSTICACLTYLEGDESTLSSVYACFLAIAHHLQTLPPNVSTALQIAAADFNKMQSLVVNGLRTIYSPAHALSFRTDPLFNQMRTNLTALYGEDFLKLGGASILQQCKKALKRLAGEGDIELNRKLQAEFGHYIVRVIQDDDDFADVLAKPEDLWALADDSTYPNMKNLLLAMHKNPTGTSAGERNHKSAKRVHSRNRARMGASKVEIGTTIVFNAKQLQRRQSVMRNGRFLRWLSKIGTTENDLQAFDKEDEEDEEDEQEGDLEDFLDELSM
jgi:hypothetical protein